MLFCKNPLQGYSARMPGAGEGVMGASCPDARLGFSGEKLCILPPAKKKKRKGLMSGKVFM